MSKYSEEFKLKIVKEHKETHIGAKSLQNGATVLNLLLIMLFCTKKLMVSAP